jgi:DNA phosphorothioation-dependent restriction protein DptG
MKTTTSKVAISLFEERGRTKKLFIQSDHQIGLLTNLWVKKKD